jgi:hypothetical protein
VRRNKNYRFCELWVTALLTDAILRGAGWSRFIRALAIAFAFFTAGSVGEAVGFCHGLE